MNTTSETKRTEAEPNGRYSTSVKRLLTPRKASYMKILLMTPKSSALAVTKSCVFLLFFVGFYVVSTGNASASVFENETRWTTTADGITRIVVCIVPESSVEQKKDIWFPHYPNPNLNYVIQHVRYALATSWEKYSSIRFVGWRFCNELTATEQGEAVGLYIHPDAENHTPVFGKVAKGRTSKETHAISFIPWGHGGDKTWCIYPDLLRSYHFECVEQFAIHEFGHLIGFHHEWAHPAVPEGCTNRYPQSSYAVSYSDANSKLFKFTINNPNDYDWDSIMNYEKECAHVTGIRFGSENLSFWDILNVINVYPIRAGLSKLPVAVAEDMKWMAWNVAWYTAHSRMGTASDASKSEAAFNYHSERMKNNAVNLGVSTQTLENIRWFAYHAAWSTANSRVGYNAAADQARETAEAHFREAMKTGELTDELLTSIHKMGWAAAWHAANYMKGYRQDASKDAVAFEAAYQQIIGNAVTSARLASDSSSNGEADALLTAEATTALIESNRLFLPLIANADAANGERSSATTVETTTELASTERNGISMTETMASGAESNRIYLPLVANTNL